LEKIIRKENPLRTRLQNTDQQGSYQFAELWWRTRLTHGQREEETKRLMPFQAQGWGRNFLRLDDPFDTKT
jgi:hypothetical protein